MSETDKYAKLRELLEKSRHVAVITPYEAQAGLADPKATPEQIKAAHAKTFTVKCDAHQPEANAELIIEMRNLLPELLAERDALLKACLQFGIGEHDMVECRICNQQGHNAVFGDQYGIKHKPNCAYAKMLAAEHSQKGAAKP